MNIINQLIQLEGDYSGKGENHEGQEFNATFIVKPIVDGAGINIIYTAKDSKNTVLHQENTIIAPNQSQSLSLWTLNSNVPFLYEHTYSLDNIEPSGAVSNYSFRYNDPNDKNKFREEISLIIWSDSEVSYNYSWGMPGEDYGVRSTAKLAKSS